MKIEEHRLEDFGGLIKILKNGDQVVTFSSCEITQKTIEFLGKNNTLGNLLFHYCNFKSVNFSLLKKINVTVFSTMHGNFNDEHLKQLEAILSLKSIKLHDTNVSRSAKKQFLQARPDVIFI